MKNNSYIIFFCVNHCQNRYTVYKEFYFFTKPLFLKREKHHKLDNISEKYLSVIPYKQGCPFIKMAVGSQLM